LYTRYIGKPFEAAHKTMTNVPTCSVSTNSLIRA